MKTLLSLASAYLVVASLAPALVARVRGLSVRSQAGIAILGALTGWTAFGAIAAWLFALFDDDANPGVVIR